MPASERKRVPVRRRERRPARVPGELSRESLERAALRYLERYDSTEDNLRRVLERVARRQLDAGEPDSELRESARGWIAEVVARAVELRWLDERRYAEGLVRQLRRRGTSHRASWQKLRHKGVPDALIREQLGGGAEPEAELSAASAYARRRRLGPWRPAEQREARRERDLAALARAGFDHEVARRIVEAEAPESLPDTRRPGAFS